MIKNIIIGILVILLLITILSYYYLTTRKSTYQSDRIKYINKKEEELDELEKNISSYESCAEQNTKYKYSLLQIKNILNSIGDDDLSIMSGNDSEMLQENDRQIKIIGKEGETQGILHTYHEDYL